MVKQIIKEAMNQNPLGLKEAVEAELRNRIAMALGGTNLREAFMVGTKVKVNNSKDDDHGKSGKVVKASRGMYVVQFDNGQRGSFNEDELMNESVGLEEGAKWELNPANYMVGSDLSYDDKLEYTLNKKDSDILNSFLSKASDDEKSKVWKMFWNSKERGNNTAQGPVNAIKYAKAALKESVSLKEAKMTDAEVLSAAKSLAANGKDPKTKAFGQGLVDFYKKEGSFTPAQVGGLQNIMKNASFHMAKDK
jgi:hypothetical protein